MHSGPLCVEGCPPAKSDPEAAEVERNIEPPPQASGSQEQATEGPSSSPLAEAIMSQGMAHGITVTLGRG